MATESAFAILAGNSFHSGMVEQMKERRYSMVVGWWWRSLWQCDALVRLSAFSSPSSSQDTPTSLWTTLYISRSFWSSRRFSKVASPRHSRLIPICNAFFYSTWPPSFSSHIKKEVTERPNAGNEISASGAVIMPRNTVTIGTIDRFVSAKYGAKNSKTWPMYSYNALLWIRIHNTNC